MRNHLIFYLNGRRFEISDARVTWTLAEFLRTELRLTGTKVVCAEGDCGACSVLVGRSRQPDAALLTGNRDGLTDTSERATAGPQGQFVYQTIDSCIAFLYQLDRCHIVTVEGLKVNGTLSPVQDRMVECHGSQCGFCTPGFVVTLHGLLEESQPVSADAGSANPRSANPRSADPRSADPAHTGATGGAARDPLTDEQLRLGLSGNLCRCTGYEQILEAVRSIDPHRVTPIRELFDDARLQQELAQLDETAVEIVTAPGTDQRVVLLPTTLAEAIAMRAQRPAAQIVSGATDIGVQRNHGRIDPTEILCLGNVQELRTIRVVEGELVLGAGATWTEIERSTRDLVPQYAQMLRRFGSPQIRNLATIGGNLANASPIADSLPFHYALDAELELASVRGNRRVKVCDFYRDYKQFDLAADELITAVHTRLPGPDEHLRLYKVSKRRDMDISTVTAGFWMRVRQGKIDDARFALGGVGPIVIRCTDAEDLVRGAAVCEPTFRAAGQAARAQIRPITDVRASQRYRGQLAENLFLKAYHELNDHLAHT
jgi:xanthine dehydrogenase small subunit